MSLANPPRSKGHVHPHCCSPGALMRPVLLVSVVSVLLLSVLLLSVVLLSVVLLSVVLLSGSRSWPTSKAFTAGRDESPAKFRVN